MSQTYTSVAGDTLRKIASKTLGTPFRWNEILEANPWLNEPDRRKRQSDIGIPDREALFSPGEVFVIPSSETLIDPGYPGDDLEACRIVLRGPGMSYEIDNAIEVSQIRFMNTMANGFSFVIPWANPGPDLVYLLREDGYYDAFLYIGGILEYQCVIYDWTRETTNQGLTCRVWCYSPAADAVDSRVEPPYTYTNITLQKLIEDNLTRPHSINAEILIDEDSRFAQVQAEETDTIAGFLQRYAEQRQAFINSKPDGGSRVWRAAIDSESVGTIEEGKELPEGFKYEYRGRARFTNYKGICETPAASLTAYVSDVRVPLTRKTTILIDSATTNAELRKAVTWHRNRVDAEAKKRVFPVKGLYAPNGKLWTENTIVTIVSPTMNAPDGFDFLIEGLERKWDSSGIRTQLHIADPVSFSTGEFS
jgi:prophage tail gpP-like protein